MFYVIAFVAGIVVGHNYTKVKQYFVDLYNKYKAKV